MKLGPNDYLKLGDWNAHCDRCGFKCKASELRREWQGYMVCKDCFEPRHPQDTIRVRPERNPIPWSRPPNDIGTIDYLADGSYRADGSIIAIGSDIYIVVGPADPDSL